MKKITAAFIGAGILSLLSYPAHGKLNEPYYGTNYTVPFAHAYRALNTLGVDHHKAIDRDVYHMKRLGFNAFRLHLWDVELSDAEGNLLDNEHLELLDYLISQLEKRGIKVMLTAQTNFGNGYPERNTDPFNAFTYDYDKCSIHENKQAQDAQANYLAQLIKHENRYTGKSYAADPDILMMEINNEPCHSGTEKEITAYINRMAKTLRDNGWKKDVLYNVSHNLDKTRAYYAADIDGTTYQWYPTGLVHGSQRHGNFLPALDNYAIPFDTIKGYDRQPRVIYEYDPGDVLDTYLYPAAARTFRKAGFDWITQFAYDPIDMARFNSEYQTHFLNLAYTPGKAIGMAIAAEATRRIPKGKDYGKFPKDTIFGDFLVSANRNLAMLNDGELYYHTNNTVDKPKSLGKLRRIAGVGSSPMVNSDGNGAYFIDKLDNDVWRLELMPDVIITSDPFKRPSLSRSVAHISTEPVALQLDLPGLTDGFCYMQVNEAGKETASGKATGKSVTLAPGVYLLSSKPEAQGKWNAASTYGDGKLMVGEYVMPPVVENPIAVINKTPKRIATGEKLKIKAFIAGSEPIDSVKVFAGDVNFWSPVNAVYDMHKTGKYEYTCEIDLDKENRKADNKSWVYDYNIVVYSGCKATTYPGAESGAPLDWDFAAGRSSGQAAKMYNVKITPQGDAISLYDSTKGYDATDSERSAISKYVGDIMADYTTIGNDRKVKVTAKSDGKAHKLNLGLVTREGFTYSAPIEISAQGSGSVAADKLTVSDTYLFPEPFPAFMDRTFSPDKSTAPAFNLRDVESVTIYTDAHSAPLPVEIETIIIE